MHKGLILKDLIKNSKHSQKEVAKHLNIDPSYLSLILRDADLKDDVIERACAFLGIDQREHFIEDKTNSSTDGYKAKYEALMEKYENVIDKHMEEKESWLQDKHQWIVKESELNNENFELKRENLALKEKLSKYESNTDIRKMG